MKNILFYFCIRETLIILIVLFWVMVWGILCKLYLYFIGSGGGGGGGGEFGMI